MYEELMRVLGLWKENLIDIRESTTVVGGETKLKLVDMVALLLSVTLLANHIHAAWIDLIGVVSMRMLKWDDISNTIVQDPYKGCFCGGQTIDSGVDGDGGEYHLLVDLKEENMVLPKKTQEKKAF